MSHVTCPHCGADLRLVPANEMTGGGAIGRLFGRKSHDSQVYQHTVPALRPWEQQRDRDEDSPGMPANIPASGGSRNLTSWRQRDIKADVITPAIWSAIGGAMIGLTSVPFAIAGQWSAMWPLGIWLGSTTLGFLACSRGILIDKSLIAHEDILTITPPPAPVIVPPPARTGRTMRAEVVDSDGQRSRFAELPDTPAMHKFACLVTQVQPGKKEPEGFTEATAKLTDLPVDAGKLDGDPAEWGFRQIREIFIARGWGNWKNPNHHNLGFVLTVAGRALLRQIAESPPPPQEDTYAE